MKNTVIIGLLGPTLDMGKQSKRWERWRPTVALCQHEDLLVSRLELLYQKRFKSLQDLVVKDIKRISPETVVVSYAVDFRDPWDLEEVYAALHDFAKAYPFDQDNEEYLVHITTGTHVAQICLYLLTESNYLPAKLLQTSPSSGKKKDNDVSGEYRIIDLDLSKYDRIAMRFRQEMDDDITFLKSGIETRNRAFNALIERIEQVAMNSTDPVLITGPTGAGKSNLARRIYELKKSRRQLKGDFIEINCATLRGDAAMSALRSDSVRRQAQTLRNHLCAITGLSRWRKQARSNKCRGRWDSMHLHLPTWRNKERGHKRHNGDEGSRRSNHHSLRGGRQGRD